MATADGNTTGLTEYVTLPITILTIRRELYAFVRPQDTPDKALLLGLPWLHDVKATFDIYHSSIEIGDPDQGERQVQSRGPQFQFAESQRLILIPTSAKYKNLLRFAKAADLASQGNETHFNDFISEDLSELSSSSDSEVSFSVEESVQGNADISDLDLDSDSIISLPRSEN
jgi:hypothetical protein